MTDMDTAEFLTVEKNLMNIELALNGLSMFLEQISNSGMDQAQAISWSNAILKTIIRQTEETSDQLAKINPLRAGTP